SGRPCPVFGVLTEGPFTKGPFFWGGAFNSRSARPPVPDESGVGVDVGAEMTASGELRRGGFDDGRDGTGLGVECFAPHVHVCVLLCCEVLECQRCADGGFNRHEHLLLVLPQFTC